MTDLGIFILGSLITAATITAMILVGRAEGNDPAMNRTGDFDDGA